MRLFKEAKPLGWETNFLKKLETLFKMFKYLFWKYLRPSRESSNSSWAEMELNIIGHFEIFPISTQTKQIFIIRLLTPLAEYQVTFPNPPFILCSINKSSQKEIISMQECIFFWKIPHSPFLKTILYRFMIVYNTQKKTYLWFYSLKLMIWENI